MTIKNEFEVAEALEKAEAEDLNAEQATETRLYMVRSTESAMVEEAEVKSIMNECNDLVRGWTSDDEPSQHDEADAVQEADYNASWERRKGKSIEQLETEWKDARLWWITSKQHTVNAMRAEDAAEAKALQCKSDLSWAYV